MRKSFRLYTIFGGMESHRWLSKEEIRALTVSSSGLAAGEAANEKQVQTALAYLRKYAKPLKGATDCELEATVSNIGSNAGERERLKAIHK
jgi:hypothetical protein